MIWQRLVSAQNIGMKQRNIKYFSQLTAKQKDRAQRFYLRAKLNLLGLDSGLQRAILSGIDFEKIVSIYDQLQGQKMCYYKDKDLYFTLRIKELLQTN